jgi:membrane protein YdbS with pleckstrin-like domain
MLNGHTYTLALLLLLLALVLAGVAVWAVGGSHWLVFAAGALVGLIVGDVLARVEGWWQSGD